MTAVAEGIPEVSDQLGQNEGVPSFATEHESVSPHCSPNRLNLFFMRGIQAIYRSATTDGREITRVGRVARYLPLAVLGRFWSRCQGSGLLSSTR